MVPSTKRSTAAARPTTAPEGAPPCGRSTLQALHPAGPIPSGGPVAGHNDGLRPQEHRQLPRPKRRRQERHQRRRRTLQHLARAASMFADSASPMSSSSPSASSAPSVVRPRSRCRPPGGRTSTSSIARSSPRVGRLPRSPSSPRAAVAVDATIVVARRDGRRNRRAWLSTRRRCRAARATNRPAATRATNIDTVRDRDAYTPFSSSSS